MPLDLIAGLSEGVMSVPQGMSYALLATVPAEIGLYNSMIYPLLFAAFGSATHLAVGVSAIENLLVAESLQRLLGIGSTDQERINCAAALSLVIGVAFLIMCIFRLGVVSSFLPDPVLSGFSTASAFVIATSQIKHIVGFSVPQSLSMFGILGYVSKHLLDVNYMSVGVASTTVVFLFFTKHINRTFNIFRKYPMPGPLIVVVVFITATWYFHLDTSWKMKVVGEIPSGLPRFSSPEMRWKNIIINGAAEEDPRPLEDNNGELVRVPNVNELIRESLLLCSLFFVIHISLAKTVAHKKGYQINANQELYACGMLNLFGSFLSCFPNAASLSRTCVVAVMGGSTILHNLWCGLLVMLTLLLITPLLAHLPYAVLGGIVIFGVSGMVDFNELKRLFHLQESVLFACRNENGALSMVLPDFVIWLTAFTCTITFGAMEGIIIAVLISLFFLLKKVARPNTAILGKLPGTYIFRSKNRFKEAVEFPKVKIFRFDASLQYPNATFFEKTIAEMLDSFLCGKSSSSPPKDVSWKSLRAAFRQKRKSSSVEYGLQELSPSENPVEVMPVGHNTPGRVSNRGENRSTRQNQNNTSEDSSCPTTPTTGVPLLTTKDFEAENIDPETLPPVLIIDTTSVNDVDVTSIAMLERVARRCRERNVLLTFANWKGIMRDFLECSKFYDNIPPELCFLSIYDAVIYAQQYQCGLVVPPRIDTSPSEASSSTPVLTFGHESSQVLQSLSPGSPGSNLILKEERRIMMENANLMELVRDQQVSLEWDGLSSIAPGFRMTSDSERGVLWPLLNSTPESVPP